MHDDVAQGNSDLSRAEVRFKCRLSTPQPTSAAPLKLYIYEAHCLTRHGGARPRVLGPFRSLSYHEMGAKRHFGAYDIERTFEHNWLSCPEAHCIRPASAPGQISSSPARLR